MSTLDVVCPVYREEQAIAAFHDRLSAVLSGLTARRDAPPIACRVIYVVDPAPDGTERILGAIASGDPRVDVLVMSRRFGHQMALVAGVDHASADAVVMLDSDGQHPPELIPDLVRFWEAGAEVVQAIREDGGEANWLRRAASRWFYATFLRTGTVGLPAGAADFRLLSRRVADVFRTEMREHNPFLRGLVGWMGFRIVYVPFAPMKREKGRSKYRPATLIDFALNGLCSFSKLPLRLCVGAGFALALLSVLFGISDLAGHLSGSVHGPGWASLIAFACFATGVQLFFLGVIGEYVGLIFDEVKRRPLYILSHRRRGDRDERFEPAECAPARPARPGLACPDPGASAVTGGQS